MSAFSLETGKGGQVVTPGTPYPRARALWIGGEGDVVVEFPGGQTATYTNVAGLLPVETVQVIASGTTATNITTIA